ncbi:MAG: response regulator [Gammaproteobacteria bacterium]|nr:response regulator [Gammaproteobacteria bacterium]
MFKIKFLTNIFLLALLVVAISSSYNIYITYPSFEQQLIQNTEEEASRVAIYLSNHVIPETEEISIDVFNNQAFYSTVQAMMKGFKLYKLRLFSATGEIIFSTVPTEIGNINENSYFKEIVAKGNNFTKIAIKGGKSMDGTNLSLDVAEIYIPIMRDEQFIGSFEIYYDITKRKEIQSQLLTNAIYSTTIAAIILLTFLYFSLRKASIAMNELNQSLDENIELNQQQAAILDSLGDGVYGVDLEGKTTFVNPAACKMLGWDKEDLINQSLHSMVHHSYKDGAPYPEVECPMYGYENINKPQKIDNEYFWNKSKACFPVEITSMPIIINTNVKGAVIAFRDISERKKVEQELKQAKSLAESANQTKSEFLSNMSHEIRTPMNGIIGLTNLALHTDLNEQQKEYIEKTHSSAKLLLGIINDILDFSKIEAGKLDLELIAFKISEVTDNLYNLVHLKAEENGIKLMINIDSSVPEYLQGDPLRLGQILINLTNNAIKFTASGGEVTVTISLKQEDESEVILYCSVNDTGVGMTDEEQSKLFQSFSQTNASIAREYGGTGLGLVISQKLTQMMDGKIGVKSEKGVGSNFYFTVKMNKVNKAMSDSLNDTSDEQLDIAKSSLINKTILLVEDNKVNQLVARKLLHLNKMQVEIANNGQEAIELIKQQPFDMVLMDCMMPVLDGYQATKEIRKLEKYRTLPIIAMTANAMKQDIEKAKHFGMNDHIAKPINPETMLLTMAKWIKV